MIVKSGQFQFWRFITVYKDGLLSCQTASL